MTPRFRKRPVSEYIKYGEIVAFMLLGSEGRIEYLHSEKNTLKTTRQCLSGVSGKRAFTSKQKPPRQYYRPSCIHPVIRVSVTIRIP